MRAIPAFAIALLLAARASAQSFPARSGETGILDVPDAEVTGAGGGQLGAELRFDRREGVRDEIGPLPLYAVGGLSDRLDLGLTVRQAGQPEDPRPSRVLFGAAMKLQLSRPNRGFPGAALGVVFDRLNERGVVGARLSLSTTRAWPVRLAAFGGGEAEVSGFGRAGPTAGLAASLALTRTVELAAEALTGPRGQNYGAALRWFGSSTVGFSVGGNYFPREDAFRIAFTVAFAPAAPKRAVPQPPAGVAPGDATAVPAAPRFTSDRPRFRLRIPMSGPRQLEEPGRLQYAPYAPPVAIAAAPQQAPERAAPKAVAPSLDDLAEARLRDQEALASAREQRVRQAREQLEARDKALSAENFRLAERDREIAAREMELDARERRTVVRGPPTQEQRRLESLAAQLASDVQKLAAIDRSYVPALDAARAREREAAAREDVAHEEATRLSASAAAATSRAEQLDLRKSALGARNRALAALEARLLAIGERIDASERQLRSRAERLDAASRRLDARAEWLDHLDKRAAEPRPGPAAPSAPQPPESKAAPKDKAVFVMVVKSPTAIVKEGGGGSTSSSSATTPLQGGAAVEKAVAAAAVVMFPTPATQLSELDRETIDNIAKLAAKEGCEVLIWARAKDPSLMAEAQRRAAEIKTRVMSVGQLDAGHVVTRITTRPGAQGVDVVVSALRQAVKQAASPAAAPTAPAAPKLQPGESGKRQIREAVQAAQQMIETCVGEHLVRGRKQRADGVLKLTVSPEGRINRVATGGRDLAGDEFEACLGAAASAWQFPSADGEYVVDVPITVVTGGTAK